MTFVGICIFRRKSALSELSSRLWVKKKEKALFFYLTILSKIVTIRGPYLMSVWHPQTPSWEIYQSLSELYAAQPCMCWAPDGLRYHKCPWGRLPSSCNTVPLQTLIPRVPNTSQRICAPVQMYKPNRQTNRERPQLMPLPPLSFSHPHALQMLLHRDKPLAFSLPASNHPLS